MIVCALCAVVSNVQCRTMKQVFTEMPDSLLPVLSHSERMDCIDYLASGMKATVKNNFGEPTTLVMLTKDFVLVNISEVSNCECKLLVNGTDSVICMIKTYLKPVAESRLTFYNMKWKVLKADKFLTLPSLKTFEQENAGGLAEAKRDCLAQRGEERMAATFTEETGKLTFRICLDDGNPDLRKSLSSYLKKKVTYAWQKGAFVQEP